MRCVRSPDGGLLLSPLDGKLKKFPDGPLSAGGQESLPRGLHSRAENPQAAGGDAGGGSRGEPLAHGERRSKRGPWSPAS
jgi:hypothetical protein